MKDVIKNRRKELTHYDRILTHLKVYGKITQLDALREYSCMRLSAVIYLLRQDGYNIVSNFKQSKNKFGEKVTFVEYSLEEK